MRLSRRGLVGADQVLVPQRPVEERGAVVDLDDRAQGRDSRRHLGHLLAERAVEEQDLGVGVREEVGELVFEVAVVHVDGRAAALPRGEDALHVLDRVVEVARDLPVLAQPELAERRRQPRGAVVPLGPAADAVTLDERGPVRLRVGDRLPHAREVPLDAHRPPGSS